MDAYFLSIVPLRPFTIYTAPETCWCTSTVTLSSKYAIYAHVHTQERDVKHIKRRSVTVRATLPKCNEKNRLDCVFLSPVKIQNAVLNF